ncbi:MAG TPA: hypothetical protein VF302_09700, partial [Candidatus Limnocylindrales bacterium]
SPDAYRSIVPPTLATRQLHDALVVDALEAWAARKAAETMVVLFLVAAGVTAIAVPAALALGERPRMLSPEAGARASAGAGGDGDGGDPADGAGRPDGEGDGADGDDPGRPGGDDPGRPDGEGDGADDRERGAVGLV